jgi:hypothetical protein
VEWESKLDPKDWRVQIFKDFMNLESEDKGCEALDTAERDYIREFLSYYLHKPIDMRDLAR